ncbi:MAG TPA: hypothetical protein G4O03_02820 [Dehalococcoidia bacterium]|nr:hypothetical protein [Dehalococcoidia bacterium]
MESLDPVAREFIQFCVSRCGTEWPALYDEMCRVAGGRRFKGLGYPELRKAGIGLGLGDLDRTYRLVEAITASGPGR